MQTRCWVFRTQKSQTWIVPIVSSVVDEIKRLGANASFLVPRSTMELKKKALMCSDASATATIPQSMFATRVVHWKIIISSINPCRYSSDLVFSSTVLLVLFHRFLRNIYFQQCRFLTCVIQVVKVIINLFCSGAHLLSF